MNIKNDDAKKNNLLEGSAPVPSPKMLQRKIKMESETIEDRKVSSKHEEFSVGKE